MRKVIILTLILPFLLASSLFAGDILVKIDPSQAASFSRKALKVGNISFRLEPLLKSSRNINSNWFIATPERESDLSGWDLAHELEAQNSEIVYAEPDVTHLEYPDGFKVESEGPVDAQYDDTWGHPKSPTLAWHLDSKHSQLKMARESVGDKGPKKIRIAHFDTGYDPNHTSTPKYLCADLQKNFIKGENENSAVDPGIKGPLQQPGHGTGTLAILAGNHIQSQDPEYDGYVGGAPFAEIVPIRLANSVIHFQTSSFAKGLYYVMEPGVECDVVSMSMGGVASKLWAEAVNDAYEKGIVIVTAAGNFVANFDGYSFPTKKFSIPS